MYFSMQSNTVSLHCDISVGVFLYAIKHWSIALWYQRWCISLCNQTLIHCTVISLDWCISLCNQTLFHCTVISALVYFSMQSNSDPLHCDISRLMYFSMQSNTGSLPWCHFVRCVVGREFGWSGADIICNASADVIDIVSEWVDIIWCQWVTAAAWQTWCSDERPRISWHTAAGRQVTGTSYGY